jgi:hypothetical protein
MTGNKKSFLSLEKKEGGSVTFRNNEKACIKSIGTIGKYDSAKIEKENF